jgi:small ligand-binding sensory domain FIST
LAALQLSNESISTRQIAPSAAKEAAEKVSQVPKDLLIALLRIDSQTFSARLSRALPKITQDTDYHILWTCQAGNR